MFWNHVKLTPAEMDFVAAALDIRAKNADARAARTKKEPKRTALKRDACLSRELARRFRAETQAAA